MNKEDLARVESAGSEAYALVQYILGDSMQEIDSYINDIKTKFLNKNEISDLDLERIVADIPIYIYYLIDIQQRLELNKGVASEISGFTQNQALIDSMVTVGERQARAQNASIKDRIVHLAYKIADNTLDKKLNVILEILSSAKKLLQKRIDESKTSRYIGNSVSY